MLCLHNHSYKICFGERSRREARPFLLLLKDGEETAYLGVLLLDLGVLLLDLGVLLLDALVEELDLGAEDIGAVGIILAVVDGVAYIIVTIDKTLIVIGEVV